MSQGSRIALAVVILALSAASAAAGLRTSVSPPHGGGWKLKPYSFGSPAGSPGINELTGTFEVSGTTMSKLRGTTGHAVNSGCNPGVQVTMLGSAPIKHVTQANTTVDFYWVGSGTQLWYPVKMTFQAHGGKPVTATGKVRIYFPGGVGDYSQGYGIGSVQATNNVIGICNLYFDVR